MSHHAHGTQRSKGHASRTREMETGTTARHSLYQDLHPEMYRPQRTTLRGRRLTDDARRAAIVEDLRTHGRATVTQIAFRLGLNIRTVSPLLTKGIDGVVVVERRASERSSKITRVWGLK